MKYFLSIFFITLSLSGALAQKFEIGAGAGVCHYKGDLAPAFKPFRFGMGGNVFFRYNHSKSLSAKGGFMYGNVRADFKNNKGDAYLKTLSGNLNIKIPEFSGQIEYNFHNFRTNASRIVSNWTPYVFGGGMYTYGITSGAMLGIGMKKEWRRQWNWGVEFGCRMPFKSDTSFDGYGFYDKSKEPNNVGLATTMQGDRYYYTNFSISYVFYKVHCPPGR